MSSFFSSTTRSRRHGRRLIERRYSERPAFLKATREDTGEGAVSEYVVFDEVLGRVITLLAAS